MANEVIPVTGYLLGLNFNKRVVCLLERNSEGGYLIESNRIGTDRLVLAVPQGIDVYRVHREFTEIKLERELFFTHESGKLGNPAYLSVIGKDLARQSEEKIELFKCPWYSWNNSSTVLERLHYSGRGLFGGIDKSEGSHPLMREG